MDALLFQCEKFPSVSPLEEDFLEITFRVYGGEERLEIGSDGPVTPVRRCVFPFLYLFLQVFHNGPQLSQRPEPQNGRKVLFLPDFF